MSGPTKRICIVRHRPLNPSIRYHYQSAKLHNAFCYFNQTFLEVIYLPGTDGRRLKERFHVRKGVIIPHIVRGLHFRNDFVFKADLADLAFSSSLLRGRERIKKKQAVRLRFSLYLYSECSSCATLIFRVLRVTSFLRKYVSHGETISGEKIRRLEEFLLDGKEERMRKWRYGILFHATRFKAPIKKRWN